MYVCGFMCLCVYMHTQAFMSVSCACLWLYIVLECVFVCKHVCMFMAICLCGFACVYDYVCVCVYACGFVGVCLYAFVFVTVFVYICGFVLVLMRERETFSSCSISCVCILI